MNFDREKVRELRYEIEEALKRIEGPVSFKVGSASFTDNAVTFKLEVSTINNDGTVNTKEAEDFRLNARLYGLLPDALNQTFEYLDQTYTIIGCKPRSKKYPILCKCGEKTFKFPARTVQLCLNRDFVLQ